MVCEEKKQAKLQEGFYDSFMIQILHTKYFDAVIPTFTDSFSNLQGYNSDKIININAGSNQDTRLLLLSHQISWPINKPILTKESCLKSFYIFLARSFLRVTAFLLLDYFEMNLRD